MFSKSKRFVEAASCAPPVGHYNIPNRKSVKLAGFEKAARWTEKPNEPNPLDSFENSTGISLSVNKSFNPTLVSSMKKKKPQPSVKKEKKDDTDVVRKSLEVDVEFQQSKVNALLEKIKSLELQLAGTKEHSLELEKSNVKLHELLAQVRNEKIAMNARNASLELKIKTLTDENDESKQNFVDCTKKLEDHAKDREELLEKLKHSEDMNVDFREQLESVETMMTENLRGLSEKYECLEETFDHVQTDYKQKLQRSNSLVEKIKEANETFKHELELMQQVYTNLKVNYDCCQEEMVEKDIKYKDKEAVMMQQLQCLQEKIGEVQASLEKSDTSLKDQKDTSKTLLRENEQMKSQLKNTEDEIERKKEECLRLLDELLMVNSRVNDLEKSKSNLAENLKRVTEEAETILKEKEEQQVNFEKEYASIEKSKEDLQEEFNCLKIKLERSNGDLERISKERREEIEKFETDRDQFESARRGLLESNSVLKADIESVTVRFDAKESEYMSMKQDLEDQIEKINRELAHSNEKLTLLEEKKPSIIDKSKLKELEDELQMWRKKYKDLELKVGPFMSQLEQFEFEKKSLLNENAYTQQEMSKLSEKYASILGHQNNKQKIHHIKKLKEENITLKNDVFKLRSEVSKLKRNQLESREKKFNSSNAFKPEGKENCTGPLRERNL